MLNRLCRARFLQAHEKLFERRGRGKSTLKAWKRFFEIVDAFDSDDNSEKEIERMKKEFDKCCKELRWMGQAYFMDGQGVEITRIRS